MASMNYYEDPHRITMESFGSTCPENWEEIADYLNQLIDECIGVAPDPDQDEEDDIKEDVWTEYCRGHLDAPKAVFC